jgi:hypothetical protein
MKKHILTLIIGLAGIISINAQSADAKNALSHSDNHFFIENKGQWPDEVLYATRIVGLDAWICKNGVLYDFYKLEEVPGSAKTEEALPNKFEQKDYTRIGHKVWYRLQGNNNLIHTEGKEKQTGYYNYLVGNDPGKHASNVGLYKEALVKNVYNGIDLRYYFDKGNIRYDYVVHPGADPSQIAFVLEGTDKTRLNPQGDLVFYTRFGQVALAELQTYQGTKDNEVSSHFVKTENGWSIAVGNYDSKQTLIIDPLIYSTYLGGSGNEIGTSIAVDASGNAYLTGTTPSANYDTTSGAYQTSYAGKKDAFVTKLNYSGTALVYSTYLGGSNDDAGATIAIDASGNAYITGMTSSTNYNITSGAFQKKYAGGDWDAFVTKLNATGTALVYSTHFGGSGADIAFSIAINASGNAYVTGSTLSANYDITTGAYKTSHTKSFDAFVTKLNTTGTALVYSTYLGGSDEDLAYSVAVDISGNAYVTGQTQSIDYDTTSGALQTHRNGNWDGFVTKLNATGTALAYSTYLGGTVGGDEGRSIAVDPSGSAYITGWTGSANYYITSGAYQTGYGNIFVTKICLVEKATISLALNAGPDVQRVCIHTPITNIAYAISNATLGSVTGLPAGVKASFGPDAITISGTPVESGTFDYTIFIYGGCSIASATGSITVNANTIRLFSASGTDSQSLCINAAIAKIRYESTGASGATFTNLPAGITGSFAFNIVTISGTPTASGIYNFTVTLTGGCGIITAKGSITVTPENTISLSSVTGTDSQSLCMDSAITNITYATTDASGATVTGLPAGVTGSFAANVVTISGTPTASGTHHYTVTLTGGCGIITAKGSIIVNANTLTLLSASGTDLQSLCINTAITNITYATTGASSATVTGLPAGVSGSFAANTVTISGTPTSSGIYHYTIALTGGCGTITAKGSITVKPDNTIGLSSAGTDAQNVKVNSSITNITYATTGATGATVTGLPAGVTVSFAANVVTISGTPTVIGTFTYTVILSGGCGTIKTTGRINVERNNQTNMQVLQIFPNPADIEVTIKGGTFTSSVQIEIIDALGRIIQAVYSLDKHTIKLQVSSLASGMYCIRITDGGQMVQGKIVVQH